MLFYLKKKERKEGGVIHLKGKIRHVDKENYFMALEVHDTNDLIHCGYNKDGDDATLILYKIAHDFFETELILSRNNVDYTLSIENDKKIMRRGEKRDYFLSLLDNKPYQFK